MLLLQISSMLLFVKQYKQEVLGVGEVALPGEGRALGEAAVQRTAKDAKDSGNKKDAAPAASSTNGTDEGTKTDYVCKKKLESGVSNDQLPLIFTAALIKLCQDKKKR